MPSSTLTLFDQFTEDLGKKVHNLSTDSLAVALTNTAPNASTGAALADITEISYTNCSSRAITTTSYEHTSGDNPLVIADLTLTASGGNVGPFRYVVLYNDTSTSDKLIGWLDYNSSLTLADGESLVLDFSAVNGILQVNKT
jgi:hypothetical protein